MPAIDLTGIYSRPYSESEEPTTYGPDDHASGTGAIDLSRIMLRPYEDNRLSSIGGSGIDDPDDGDDGGGGGPGDETFGNFVMFHSSTDSNDDEGAYQDISPITEGYIKADIYFPQATFDSYIAGGSATMFSHEFLGFATDNDHYSTYEAIYFTTASAAFTPTTTIKIWDYYSDYSQAITIVADTWYEVEVGWRVNGAEWEAAFRVDGSTPVWELSGTDFPGDFDGITTIMVGGQYGPFNQTVLSEWYIDNVRIATDDWISDGGTSIFFSDHETGDFSDYTGTFGTIAVDTPPA